MNLRANETTAEIPVIIVSADATPGQVQRLKQAGAQAYLTKPIAVGRFLQVLDEALKSVDGQRRELAKTLYAASSGV